MEDKEFPGDYSLEDLEQIQNWEDEAYFWIEKENQKKGESRQAKFSFEVKQGDLFSCPAIDSLAHCVSGDFVMGKGIALSFKTTFGSIDELKAQEKKTGEVAILKRENRFIYYLVTKPRYYTKPTYATLRSSLNHIKQHCVDNNVTRLSIPRLGCGLDKLDWYKVSSIIYETFHELDLAITVYHYA